VTNFVSELTSFMSDTTTERANLQDSEVERVLFDEMVVGLDFVAREHPRNGRLLPFRVESASAFMSHWSNLYVSNHSPSSAKGLCQQFC